MFSTLLCRWYKNLIFFAPLVGKWRLNVKICWLNQICLHKAVCKSRLNNGVKQEGGILVHAVDLAPCITIHLPLQLLNIHILTVRLSKYEMPQAL